ncbi:MULTISPECIES: phosphoribosylformylglycinamidine synthase subunit PurS [unclassified Campylobacter]|uniref:phosphoribosylformylglycinamidine synthase subunit PurS n=1 Tax=unclassified Campylobacter TaxID=2593542 RepID=UPI0022E9EC21|nr:MULTISPECIES: phosphoribosylformylglycinamidine synthase subunit PurS [unclassified Campylobacter]MBQ2430836.1 phosphoribosylformylglycinamidine synthase subunit PurS [Campylobacter sp.]MDA3079999.1 phosphoribosylformylglycinamidine synthase subunit PurS [Campylobacter sp. CS_NA2]MDA3086453.1 phosphoribosylformylglycinamidine synthase subunit PurS [Campylobacter sp. CS_ED1]MDA3091021.1 phosphoribosylformylglycinamidine synthase subunit PurS [Campylobacter sp. CS_ED2]WBR51883.1 phosphoribosy
MKVVVNVKLKPGVLDPQGKAVKHALSSLGFKGVGDVRIGKQIVLEIEESDKEKARKIATDMCDEILANTVIEDYEIVL